nr:integrator complex subunit 6 homolog isoform X2 [Lepeophtheirus salmonis]
MERLQEEQDFFNAISDNSHLKKKKVAPKPPSISKAKVLRISPSDGFIYDDPTSSENHMNQINQPFHPKNSTPLSNSSNELLEYGILQKPSQKRNLKNVPEIITPLNNIEPDLIAESSKNKLNISSASSLSDVSNDKKLNKRLDSDTSERTIIARDTLPRKIKIVHSDSSESDLASIGDPEFVRLNFKSKDMSSPNNIKKYYPDEKGNLENKYESVDGGFSITDEGMVTSTLRDNKDTFNDSIDESIISGTRMDGNQNYNKVEGKLKMCKPVYYYSSTDTEKDMSDLENVTNISDLNKDMSIISETSTYSIHFQNFKEGSVSKKVETDEPIGYIPGYSSDTNNDSSFIEKIYTPSDPKISANPKYEMKTNATLSTTEIKQIIPVTISSSSSSDSSDESQKYPLYTKIIPSSNVHSFESLTNSTHIDTQPLPKNEDTTPQTFTNIQQTKQFINKKMISKDDFSTTEMKQCIPRTLSSSSSSDSSSDSPKLGSKTKSSPPNNVHSFGSLTHPIQIDTKPLPKNNDTAPQSFTNMQAINNYIHEIQLNDDFSTTEIKQCIPRTLSSSSSSDSSSDSPKLGFKTKSSPPNNVHSFGSLTHPIQIDTKPLPKNNDTATQSFTNMQAINNNIHEIQLNDDFSTTEIKQCIPRTLSSSSSSDSSSDSPKLVSKTKIALQTMYIHSEV